MLTLNVGGEKTLKTEKDLLQSVPGSLLSKMFSDMHELKMIDEQVFLDRDGTTFTQLVNYLRNERKIFPEFENKHDEHMFIKELHFWGIDSHSRDWQEQVLGKLDKSFKMRFSSKRSSKPFDFHICITEFITYL